MKGWLQRKLINLLVRHLFNTITAEDVLRRNDQGQVMFRGRPLDQERIDKIKADAETFKNSTLWHLLRSEVQFQANVRMFAKSQSVEDILAGKMMLHVIETQDQALHNIKNL